MHFFHLAYIYKCGYRLQYLPPQFCTHFIHNSYSVFIINNGGFLTQASRNHGDNCPRCPNIAGATARLPFFCQNCTSKFVHYSQELEFRTIFKQCLKMRYSPFRYPKYRILFDNYLYFHDSRV